MTAEHAHPDAVETMAAVLADAHASGKRVDYSALPVPTDKDSAMKVQALVQARTGKAVLGWKVALGPGAEPIAAPLFEIYRDGSDIAVVADCAIEVELAVRLGKDIPKRTGGAYVRTDILDAIESVFLGIEVIGSRFEHPTSAPFLSFLADNLGNRAYVMGESVSIRALDEAKDLSCFVMQDDKRLHQALAVHPAGDPLVPLLAYANRQSDYLGGLKAGQLVTTGSLCGVLSVSAAGQLTAELGNVGQASIQFTA